MKRLHILLLYNPAILLGILLIRSIYSTRFHQIKNVWENPFIFVQSYIDGTNCQSDQANGLSQTTEHAFGLLGATTL